MVAEGEGAHLSLLSIQEEKLFDQDIPSHIYHFVAAMEVEEHRCLGNNHWAVRNPLEHKLLNMEEAREGVECTMVEVNINLNNTCLYR